MLAWVMNLGFAASGSAGRRIYWQINEALLARYYSIAAAAGAALWRL